MTWTQAIRTQSRRAAAPATERNVIWGRIAIGIGGLALWWLLAVAGVLPATLLPNPIDVAVRFVTLLPTGEFWSAIGATLLGALIGLAIAIVIGIPLGIITGRFTRAELSLRFLVDFARAFPAIALVGVLVLLLGRTVEMKSVLIAAAVTFPILIQTQHGVRRVPSMIEETCAAFRISAALHVRKVLLPSAAPSILTGLRLSATVAVLVAISSEVLTGASGVGERISNAQVNTDAPTAFAYILAAGLLGYLVNAGVGALRSVALKWRPNESAEA